MGPQTVRALEFGGTKLAEGHNAGRGMIEFHQRSRDGDPCKRLHRLI